MTQANNSLQAAEAECAAGRTAPRVSLSDIEAAISEVHYRSGIECVMSQGGPLHGPLETLTVAFVVMKNGFVLIGKSAPASAANFDRDLGKKLAFEDAVRQAWPLMGFALRDRLVADVDKSPG